MAETFIIFRLDEQRYALPVAAVRRVVRAVQLTLVAATTPEVLGVIDIHGQIVEVVSLRRMLALSEREIEPSDQFIIVDLQTCDRALLVDAALGVVTPETTSLSRLGSAGADDLYATRVIKDQEGLIVVWEPSQLLQPTTAPAQAALR